MAVALAAALVAALATVFVFGATKDAGAQTESVEVRPSTINLGQVAQGSTEQTTIKITNDGSSDAVIGGVNFTGSGAELVKLVDQSTGEEFIVDTATGLLTVLDPITGLPVDAVIDLQGNTQRIFNAVFEFADGTDLTDIGGTLEFLDNGTTPNTVDTVTVAGQSRQCTVEGTEGDDALISDVPGDSVICGLGGNDTIDASLANGGDDTILGGTGDDTINMKDGTRREYANGGSGKDLCKPKDKKDRVKSCGTKGGKRR